MFMFTKRSLPLLLVMLLCTLNATASRGTKNWYFGSFTSNVISKLDGAPLHASHNSYYTFSDLTDVSFNADNLRDLQFTARADSMRIYVGTSGTSTKGIMLLQNSRIKVPVCKGEQVVFTLKVGDERYPCSFTWTNVDESGKSVASGNARSSTTAPKPYIAKAKANGYIILANTDNNRHFYVSNIRREPQEKSFAFSVASTTVDLPSCYDAASHGFMATIPASTSNGVETVTYSVPSRNGVVYEQNGTAVVDNSDRLRLINKGKVELTANVTYLDSTTTTATTTLNVTAADLTYVTPENGSENTFTVSNFKYDDDTDAPIAAEGIVSHVYNDVPGITFTTVATPEQVTVVKRIGNTDDYGLIDIDGNGYTFPFKFDGIGYATMGTVFKFSPKVNGKLSFSGYFLPGTNTDSKVQLYDDKGTALGGSHDVTNNKVTISDIDLDNGKDYYLYTGQQTDEFALTEFAFEPSYKFYDKQHIATTAAVADSTGITSWANITLDQNMQAAGSCSAIPFGNVKSVTVDNTGAITNITYKDGISYKEKGGAILVIANSATYGQASYILTIPYIAHKWNFYNSIKAVHKSDKTGFDINKSNINPDYDDWHVTYEVREYDKNTHELTHLNGAVLANARQLYKDNAYYVNETAGLLMLGTPLSFGVHVFFKGFSDMSLADQFNATPDQVESCDLISFSKGSKILIPAHDGDFIKIYFRRHAAGSGSNVAITNATDLNGKEFTADKPLKITQWKDVDNSPRGCYIIKAKPTENDPYVHLKVADNGWTAIASIEVAQDSMASDMKLSKGKGTKNAIAFTAKNNSYVRPTSNNNYQFVVSYGSMYSDMPIATVNKATLTYEGQITASVLKHWEERDKKGNLAHRYNDTIQVSDGAGRLRIHQDVYDENTSEADRYLVNQFDTWIAVGQMTQQTYPYTWDFTETNINNKSSASYKHRKDYNEGFGSWTGNTDTSKPTQGGNYVNVIETYKDDKLNVTYTKPAFAAGSELLALHGPGESKTLGAIAEAAGVGFGTSDGNDGLNNKSLSFAGKNITIKPTSGNSRITIPGVKSKDRIYMKLDGSYFPGGGKNISFNVKNATLISSDPNANDCQGNVFRFDAIADGDVTIDCIFDGGVTIEKIAVTNLLKTVNKYGYATESRDHAIDYSLQQELTRNYVHPYAITKTAYGAVGNKGDVQVKLTEANEVKVLPASTGVVLYRDPATTEHAIKSEDKMWFPMFYPAMNIEESTVPEGNLMVANVEQGTTDLVEPAGSTIFFLTHTYYPYNAVTKKWGSKTEAGKEIFCVYRKKSGGNNKMGANKAYLQVPATVERIWDMDPNLTGPGTASAAKVGVIFINTDDSETTDINIVPDVPNNGKLSDTGAYYTLQGVKLDGRPTMPGIYIHNGRKEVIR